MADGITAVLSARGVLESWTADADRTEQLHRMAEAAGLMLSWPAEDAPEAWSPW